MFVRLKIFLLVLLYSLTMGLPNEALALPLEIEQKPLFLATSVDPNIIFSLDDSGSMQWEAIPDGDPRFGQTSVFMFPRPASVYGGFDERTWVPLPWGAFDINNVHAVFGRSAATNPLYYDPNVDYSSWARADGTLMPDATPDAALYNPGDPDSDILDLTILQRDSAFWFTRRAVDDGLLCFAPNGFCVEGDAAFWPITFFVHKGIGELDDTANFYRYQVRDGVAYELDLASNVETQIPEFEWSEEQKRSVEDEVQNFANWFQYHRSRISAARAGIGQAFQSLPIGSRVGFAAINQGSGDVDGQDHAAIVSGLRPFGRLVENEDGKDIFYSSLYGRTIQGRTPLRTAAESVGEYFERTDNRGPWGRNPGPGGSELPSEHLSCRQSFHILMTDGFWTEGNDFIPSVGNADGQPGIIISGPGGETFQYSPGSPFQDSFSNTLADVAMDFWKRDLRTDLDNRVPPSSLNSAFWQHLTTFGIGFGVEGNISSADAFAAIETGDSITWPDPTSTNAAKIDDLLHFGLNGRGGFFSAGDPESFAKELSKVLEDIVARASATTGVAVSATRLTTDAFVYTGDFDSSDYTGQLRALNPVDGTEEWSASAELQLKGDENRNIVTFEPVESSGVPFKDETSAIEARLLANVPDAPNWTFENLVNYIRGSDALEQSNNGLFRNRGGMLADIVNSRPVFSGRTNEGWARAYPDGEGSSDYITYIDTDKVDVRVTDPDSTTCGKRCDTVFVGANGGMLHAFDARTGEEHFAYIPSALHGNLYMLADPGYTHQFYVDGQITVADAKIGSEWKTVLVGGLGAGGRGIYALDVSKPQSFTQDNVLWEFTSEDDPDLGFTYGEPLITRLGDGTWVAVFGNGYNSVNRQAYLYAINLADGSVEHKIKLGDAGANGLSGVVGWRDVVSRTYLDRVYAGDLNGTVWRVDFGPDSKPNVVYANGLFTDPDNRPITATPNLAANPGGGLIVYVGTGKLIEADDRGEPNPPLERFYALYDKGKTLANKLDNKTNWSQVTVESGPDIEGVPSRELSNVSGIKPSGWFMELNENSTAASGERVLAPPRIVFGRVVLSSYEPVEDPCQPGGVQRVYVLDALTGEGALPFCENCGAVEIGAGAPFSPPIAIRPQKPGDGSDVTFPGIEDSDNPPNNFPKPPDPTAGADTQGWCSEFGIPPLFAGSGFLSLGTICEGRQVWRQIR